MAKKKITQKHKSPIFKELLTNRNKVQPSKKDKSKSRKRKQSRKEKENQLGNE